MDMKVVALLMALTLTIIVEWCMLLIIGEKRKRVLYSSIPINALTNLPLNMFVPSSGLPVLVLAEVVIVLIEATLYFVITKDIRQSVIYSALCNIASLFFGILVLLMILLIN